MAWASDPTNLSFVLAGLIGLAFLFLALRPRERFAEETVAAGGPMSEPEPEPEPPPPPKLTPFEFLVQNGVEKWNAACADHEYVNPDFSDVGAAFQTKAATPGSKIWGIPIEFQNSKPRLMLRGINLAGANLTGCDLHYADLRSADLTEACLAGANLEAGLMRNARLVDADLRGANLDRAILSSANLRGANLEGASVDGATFSWADMRDAKGNRVQLEKVADLGGARLANASFDGARARFQVAGRNLLTKKPFVRR